MKKICALFMCCLMLVLFAAGCSGSVNAPEDTQAPVASTSPDAGEGNADKEGKKIYIGLSVPLTGAGAESGLKQKFSAEIAVAQINEAGGVNGAALELVVLDDAQDAAQAATVAQTFCDDERITAVIAHSASAVTAATQPVFEENKMPNISAASSVDSLSSFGYTYWWRNYAKNSNAYPSICAYVVNTLKAQKVALIYQNAEMGMELAKYAAQVQDDGKFEVVVNEAFNSGTETDFTTLITKVMASEAEAILFIGNYTEGGTLLKQMLDMGCRLPVVSNNWLTYQTTVDLAGADGCANLVCVCNPSPFTKNEVAVKYLAAFEQEFGEGAIPNGPAMCTYDAVYVIAKALSDGATKENIAQWCKNIGGYHEDVFTVDGLISGDGITFTSEGDLASPQYTVVKVDSTGKFCDDGLVDMTGFTY